MNGTFNDESWFLAFSGEFPRRRFLSETAGWFVNEVVKCPIKFSILYLWQLIFSLIPVIRIIKYCGQV